MKHYIKVCPQCGGTNITIPPTSLDIQMTVRDYCLDCMNRGAFPEVEKEYVKSFQKELKKSQ